MLINVPNNQYNDLGVQPPNPLREFKGENKLDAFNISPNYAVRTKNLTAAGYPSLVTRPGYTFFGTALTGRALGIGVWKDTEFHAVVGGVWSRWGGSAWVSMKTGLSATAPWTFCNFIGNYADIAMIGTNGVDKPQLYKGTSVSDLPNAPVDLNYIAQHNGRLYGAVSNGTEKNTVHFSALRKPEDWTTTNDAGTIVVESTDGQTINGLKAGDRHLLVFKPSSVYELWGNGPRSYELQIIADNIGLLNNKCATTVGGIVYWMDQNGVYMYGGSRPRKDFSLPIESYITGMNKAHASKASIASRGSSLFISIPYGSETEPQTTLEYDTRFGTWYVWRDIEPTCYALMGGDLYAGTTTGRIMKFDGSTSDNGTAINWEWVSAPLFGASTAQRVKLYRFWYNVDIPIGSTLTVWLSKDATGDSNWVQIKTLTITDAKSGRIVIPADPSFSGANWLRIRLTGTGPMKLTELDYQERQLPMY